LSEGLLVDVDPVGVGGVNADLVVDMAHIVYLMVDMVVMSLVIDIIIDMGLLKVGLGRIKYFSAQYSQEYEECNKRNYYSQGRSRAVNRG